MLINVVEGEEVRIAVVRRGLLEELYMERSSTESHIGNIYKGRVTNVEPSIQAAFIDFGVGKNGFLHISDLHPQYFPKRMQPKMPRMQGGRNQPPKRQHAGPGHVPAFQPPPEAAAAPGDVVGPAEIMPRGPEAGSLTRAEVGVGTNSGSANEGVANISAPGDEGVGSNGVPSMEGHGATGAALEENGNNNTPVAEKAVESQPMAHEVASESAGVSMERPAQETSKGEPEPQAADAENGTGAEGKASDAAAEEHGAGEESEADSEPTIPTEEPADFGSAYTSEFGDEFDEEFAGVSDEELDDGHMKPMEKVGRKTPRRERPPIQQCLRRGQEVIVQVTKEGIGTKGPTLTTYVSCPGRYLVMMPGMAQLGVSRKIEDLEQRRELKRTLQELNPPRNLGFIIRTAGTEVSKKELQGDLNYLVRMWKVIANRIRSQKAPVELYQESDLVIRTIRDVFSDEIDRIIVDNEQVASRIRDFLSIVDPRSAGIVELYTGTMPLFQKFGVEREIEKINSRRVELPNGGSLVIDSAEALVAIDVNSGRYREQRDAELTAFNMNKEALTEVVRQLRLRDLGGVIVIDFIDMREERHKREIEHLLREELKNDRARTKVLRMSQFCMIELTRQRVRPSLKRSIYMDCPHCHGSALIKTPESVSLDVMRRLAAGATRVDVTRLDVKAYPSVATFLLNRKRKALVDLEEKTGKRITITPDESLAGDQISIAAYDLRNSLLNLVL